MIAPITRAASLVYQRAFGNADDAADAGNGHRAAYLLITAYFLIGIFGRFPWKADEPYSFAIVWNILVRGEWLVPYVAGDPFLEKPPLMYWLGALFAKALPALPPHESSRLAVVACLVLTVGALRWGALTLYRERCVRQWAGEASSTLSAWRLTALALLAGMPGLAEHAHKFTADLGQLAGAALAVAALASASARYAPNPEAHVAGRVLRNGLLFGVGTGIALLSKGLLLAGIAGLALAACVAALPRFRRVAVGFIAAAALGALPFALPWPLLLYCEDPYLFSQWFWVNNIGRFAGFTALGGHDNPFANRLLSLVALGAPATVLMMIALWRGMSPLSGLGRRVRRLCLHRPAYTAVGLFVVSGLATLLSSASMRDIYLLPIMPALALATLPMAVRWQYRRRWPAVLVDLTVGLLLTVIIATWLSLEYNGQPGLLYRLWPGLDRRLPVPFTSNTGCLGLLAPVVVILAWWRVIRGRREGRIFLHWAAGLATLWCVALLLLLPWLDAARSYRETFSPLRSLTGQCACLATDGLGESELGMLHYVAGLRGVRIYAGWSGDGDGVTLNPAADACDWLLVQDSRACPQRIVADGWREIWRGHRPADHNGFVLYRRHDHSTGFQMPSPNALSRHEHG
ncbi:glycosyltransferase family 39 protein [Martelella alba]|uniref:Glycosyltransferase family 39 protein n=1 Tax=Martelella alba TaxID=2590451 RepID=A0ABY2SEW6_9HYPH|nr:glycosyltransferase family 39 protein [Martelella alba]